MVLDGLLAVNSQIQMSHICPRWVPNVSDNFWIISTTINVT